MGWRFGPVLLGLLLILGAAPAPDVADALNTIQSLKPEGTDNVAAARAWKQLASQGPDSLTAILAGMQDDRPTAANWLRQAVDAVAERAKAEGKPLPLKDLETFLNDSKMPRGARRLAYELITRNDKDASTRLLPGLLNDPSPELRRDAVAARITAADKLMDDDKEGAKKAYEQAFAAVIDSDQADDLVKKLEKLGVKADRAKHFGFILRWRIIGPFDSPPGKGFDKTNPPESGPIDLQAKYPGKDEAEAMWTEYTSEDPYGIVDLNKGVKNIPSATAYAYTVVEVPAGRTAELRLGCITAIKATLNGKQVFALEEYHHGMEMDQYRAPITLKAGRNEILLKVCQNEKKQSWEREWRFQARLCDVSGVAIPFEVSDK